MGRRSISVCFPALLLLVAGCSWTSADGTRHTLIIGIALIETNTRNPGVEVQDHKLVGISAGTDGFALGLVRRHHVAIDPAKAQNIVFSVKSSLWNTTVFAIPVSSDRVEARADDNSGEPE